MVWRLNVVIIIIIIIADMHTNVDAMWEKRKRRHLIQTSGMKKILLMIHKGNEDHDNIEFVYYTTKIKISDTETFNVKITISEIITHS